MNDTSAANISLREDLKSSKDALSKAEGITLCSAFMLTFVLIVVGNLLTIILFAKNKGIRRKNLFLPINMACADLLLGVASLPIYTYYVGFHFQLWTTGTEGFKSTEALDIFFLAVDTLFSQVSLLSAAAISCERFYAIRRPFQHRTLSKRAYGIVIFVVWILARVVSATWTGLNVLLSQKHAMIVWEAHTLILVFIMCGCYIGIWRKFQNGSVASSHQQNRELQNRRLTKTLLFVSGLTLLAWFPLVVLNFLIYLWNFNVQLKFYFMANVLNYSNAFVNPFVYALRIAEFRQALAKCCFGREPPIATMLTKTKDEGHGATEISHELAFEQDLMDSKL